MAANSPRVNSARLGDYLGRTVRLTGKIARTNDSSDDMIVQASDGGEVKVKMVPGFGSSISASYIEVIGVVQGPDSVKAQACISLGDQLDLDLVDFVVEKWHDPKFANMF